MKRVWITLLIGVLAWPLTWAQAQLCSSRTDYETRAEEAANTDDYETVLDAARCMVEVEPDNVQGFIWLSYAQIGLGDYYDAMDTAENGLQVDDETAYLYNVRADAYGRLGDFESAWFDAQRALELDPDSTYALNLIAEAQLQLGDPRAAIAAATENIRSGDGNAFTFLIRAQAYYALGDTANAVDDVAAAIDLFPESRYYMRVESEFLIADGNLRRAIRNLESLRDAVTDPIITAMLAFAYAQNEDTDAARDILSEIDLESTQVLNSPFTFPIRFGETFAFTFDGTEGESIRLDALNVSRVGYADPYLLLLGPDGLPIAFDDDRGLGYDALLELQLPADGQYTLYVGLGNAGDYRVTLVLAR
jgi:tetratricopeptide (TPR) repeat protein